MSRTLQFVMCVSLVATTSGSAVLGADLQSKTETGWQVYVGLTEKRIDAELKDPKKFLIRDFMAPKEAAKVLENLKKGEVYVDKMETRDAKKKEISVDDGIVHHWYGAVFIPNMTVSRLLRWIQSYDDHQKYFTEVKKSVLRKSNSDRSAFDIGLQLVRTKVVTVHYDTDHHVTFRDVAPGKVSSTSISTRIQEIDNFGKKDQSLKPAGHDSGYFWHTNGYWRYQEADGGVYVECESLSLSRSIPFGLGWIVGHFVESVPKESLSSMLTSIREGAKSAPK